MKLGIRREDKSQWEARIPLVPQHIAELTAKGVEVQVERSDQRVFEDRELEAAGATLVGELEGCPIVLGVKEVPEEAFLPSTTYVFFSHTIKGQAYNMPMLRRMMELGCSLIDYERIVDEEGRRLVSFSRFAGMAGMIDALWILGRRWAAMGRSTPLTELKQALHYGSLNEARSHVRAVAERFRAERSEGVVIGLTGMGRVSRGALEVARALEPSLMAPDGWDHELGPGFHLVLFDVPDLVERISGGPVDGQEYRLHPERYRSNFAAHSGQLDLLMNGIYWEPKYPRLLTKHDVEEAWAGGRTPRLQVIADVSCDIEGSIEVTLEGREPGNPSYVYDVETGRAVDGVEGRGPVIMATEILPTELPREASQAFSEALIDMMPALAAAQTERPLADWNLPPEMERAVILHRGRLTPDYAYLSEFLD